MTVISPVVVTAPVPPPATAKTPSTSTPPSRLARPLASSVPTVVLPALRVPVVERFSLPKSIAPDVSTMLPPLRVMVPAARLLLASTSVALTVVMLPVVAVSVPTPEMLPPAAAMLPPPVLILSPPVMTLPVPLPPRVRSPFVVSEVRLSDIRLPAVTVVPVIAAALAPPITVPSIVPPLMSAVVATRSVIVLLSSLEATNVAPLNVSAALQVMSLIASRPASSPTRCNPDVLDELVRKVVCVLPKVSEPSMMFAIYLAIVFTASNPKPSFSSSALISPHTMVGAVASEYANADATDGSGAEISLLVYTIS